MGDFKKLDFNDQVITIANDIKEHFWREDAKIIANSFGGYLLLQALSKLDQYIGKILLSVANYCGVFKRGNQHEICPAVCRSTH